MTPRKIGLLNTARQRHIITERLGQHTQGLPGSVPDEVPIMREEVNTVPIPYPKAISN